MARKHPRFVVIGEQLGVAPPGNHRVERSLRIGARQVILEFDLESHSRRVMTLPFSEYAANMRCQGHKLEQVFPEESFALVGTAMREHPACGGEIQRAVF